MDKITIERETLQAALDDLIRLAGLSADKAPWRRISALRAALAAQPAPAAVPPGYVLVPIEPTRAMLNEICPASASLAEWRENYRAMIAAAKRVAP